MDYETITEEEVKNWCRGLLRCYGVSRLTEILTGEYDLKEAREDILSLRGEQEE